MNIQPNYDEAPKVVIWEVTQACDLACIHCRAYAQPARDSLELSTREGRRLIDQIAKASPDVFVLTGGDPLKRPDLFELIEYAASRGLRTSVTPSVTSRLTHDSIERFKKAGVARLALSLDGSTAAIHDAFRGVSGAFDQTLQAMYCALACQLPLQINSTMSKVNYADFDALAGLVQQIDIALWSVFFLVPTGRAKEEQMLTSAQTERLFGKLFDLSQRVPFGIKTTEAPHYRRFVMQKKARMGYTHATHPPSGNPRSAVNDGKGFLFISHRGDVFPSGFLPAPSGNVRTRDPIDIYRKSMLFRLLRDSSQLKGKCGACEFRNICGGSRARAFAITGDAMAEDPSCIYVPGKKRPRARANSTPHLHAAF